MGCVAPLSMGSGVLPRDDIGPLSASLRGIAFVDDQAGAIVRRQDRDGPGLARDRGGSHPPGACAGHGETSLRASRPNSSSPPCAGWTATRPGGLSFSRRAGRRGGRLATRRRHRTLVMGGVDGPDPAFVPVATSKPSLALRKGWQRTVRARTMMRSEPCRTSGNPSRRCRTVQALRSCATGQRPSPEAPARWDCPHPCTPATRDPTCR